MEIIRQKARDDFNRARGREFFLRLLNLLSPQKQELLNFHEVKGMVRAKSESYKGLQAVSIDRIVGSEGRYQDFNKAFLPKRDHIRSRWENI
jgi:hypothetical protein